MTIETARRIEAAYQAGNIDMLTRSEIEPYTSGGEPDDEVLERAMDAAQAVLDAA